MKHNAACSLVLEILKQEKSLSMSLYEEGDLSPTLRHYTVHPVVFPEITRLCHEIAALLGRADSSGMLSDADYRGLTRAAQVLRDHLLSQNIKDRLKTSPARDLILSLDEELIPIPWELLFDGSEFLSLRFNVGRVVRAAADAPPARYRGGDGLRVGGSEGPRVGEPGGRESENSVLKMLIMANPTDDLPAAYREGIEIKDKFEARRSSVRIDFKSTRIDRLYARKNLGDYDIVHYAGHCDYDRDNPHKSGWLFQDGRFTAQDALAMAGSPVPRLVFSNACHSARAHEENADFDCQRVAYSLAGAFLVSGVRHYVGTIRKIEDPISLAFAASFYARITAGDSVGESMRMSRLKIIQEHGRQVVLWASYVLYGNPRLMLLNTADFSRAPAARQARRMFNFRLPAAAARLFLRHPAVLRFLAPALGAAACIIFLILFFRAFRPDVRLLFTRAQRAAAQGNNDQALAACRRILDKNAAFLAVYPLFGDTHLKLGDKERALAAYFDYARASEKRGDTRHLASAYSGIGWCYHVMGNYPKAREFYTKAADLSHQARDKLNEAAALRRLAVWHIDKKENDKALELLTKSSEINRQLQHIFEHRYNLARDYFDIGLVFTNKDDYAAAREFYGKSRAIFESLNLRNELSDCYFNTGELYMYEKEYQRALENYMAGLKIDETHRNKMNLPGDYAMIGELFMEMENWPQAQDYFMKAAVVAEEIKDVPDLAAVYHKLGIVYKKRGRRDESRDSFMKARALYKDIDPAVYDEIGALLKDF